MTLATLIKAPSETEVEIEGVDSLLAKVETLTGPYGNPRGVLLVDQDGEEYEATSKGVTSSGSFLTGPAGVCNSSTVGEADWMNYSLGVYKIEV